MSLFGGLKTSASALRVERLRMNVIAENIANAESTHGPRGGPYRRKQVLVGAAPGIEMGSGGTAAGQGGVRAYGVVEDRTPDRIMLDPSHPDADAKGYVRMPNVDVPVEMVDMMVATRAYEANAVAFASQRQSQQRTLELLA
jgi:flagellar basal-body rod protein FlgC